MTKLEILRRAEARTLELYENSVKKNGIYKEKYGHDNSFYKALSEKFLNDLREIWQMMK